MITMPKELQEAIRRSRSRPVRLADPETHTEYVIVPARQYDLVHGLFHEDPLTSEERQNLLMRAGLRAGWDDLEMDVYNDLDPRGSS